VQGFPTAYVQNLSGSRKVDAVRNYRSSAELNMNDRKHIFSLRSLFVKQSHFAVKILFLEEQVPNTFSTVESDSFSTEQWLL
jgi:hypothetical protein